jgi:hypothetical protein
MQYVALLLGCLRRGLRPRSAFLLENVALRQLLAVYQRRGARPWLRAGDRCFWSLLARMWPDWRSRTACRRRSRWITVRSSFPALWTPGRTDTESDSSSAALGSRRTTPSSNRSTDTSGRNAWANTGSSPWRRQGRPSKHGGSSTTRSGPIGPWASSPRRRSWRPWDRLTAAVLNPTGAPEFGFRPSPGGSKK